MIEKILDNLEIKINDDIDFDKLTTAKKEVEIFRISTLISDSKEKIYDSENFIKFVYNPKLGRFYMSCEDNMMITISRLINKENVFNSDFLNEIKAYVISKVMEYHIKKGISDFSYISDLEKVFNIFIEKNKDKYLQKELKLQKIYFGDDDSFRLLRYLFYYLDIHIYHDKILSIDVQNDTLFSSNFIKILLDNGKEITFNIENIDKKYYLTYNDQYKDIRAKYNLYTTENDQEFLSLYSDLKDNDIPIHKEISHSIIGLIGLYARSFIKSKDYKEWQIFDLFSKGNYFEARKDFNGKKCNGLTLDIYGIDNFNITFRNIKIKENNDQFTSIDFTRKGKSGLLLNYILYTGNQVIEILNQIANSISPYKNIMNDLKILLDMNNIIDNLDPIEKDRMKDEISKYTISNLKLFYSNINELISIEYAPNFNEKEKSGFVLIVGDKNFDLEFDGNVFSHNHEASNIPYDYSLEELNYIINNINNYDRLINYVKNNFEAGKDYTKKSTTTKRRNVRW